ncbi:MAG: hypothetical protein L0H75_10825, partial [Nitrosospira sp.]|nr:hypothetical protein [Nitrosospira sp.]
YTFPAASLWATVTSMVALPLSLVLGEKYGAVGVLGGMLVGDLIWIAVVAIRLHRAGRSYVPDKKGISKLIAAAVAGGGFAIILTPYCGNLLGVLLSAAVITAGYIAAVLLLKPFSHDDRLVLAKLIPESLRFRLGGK